MAFIKSLHTKLIVSFLALMFIPLVATLLYGHFFTRSALAQQAVERSQYQVRLQADSIVSAVQQVQGDAVYLGASRSLAAWRLQTDPADIAKWQVQVAQDVLVLASVRPMYHRLRLLTLDGTSIADVVQQGDGRVAIQQVNDSSNATSDLVQAALQRPLYGVYVAPALINNVALLHYAIRLTDAVLLIDLDTEWLLRAMPIRPGTDTWALFDENGDFIVYPASFDPASVSAYVDAMLLAGQGSLETEQHVLAYQTISFSSSTASANAPMQRWVIFRQTPKAVLYAAVHDFYHLAWAFMGGATLLAVLLALLTSNLLVRPLQQLRRMASEFGHTGQAPALPPALPEDELGSLTRTFVAMAHELEGKRKQERRLIERLIRAQEEERKLVAYDLHDGLIQQLVGARLQLTHCQRICTKHSSEASSNLQHGCDTLSEAIVEARRIIEGLRPAVLDDLGIAAALEELAQSCAQSAQWALHLDIHALPQEPDKSLAVTLYRIAQEALSNIRKHAQARQVWVSLHNGDGISLSIRDDGQGFDPAALHPENEGRGLGITTMQERASLLGGRCTIQSERGRGTCIAVQLPCLDLATPEAAPLGALV